jgi:hypothetical protein
MSGEELAKPLSLVLVSGERSELGLTRLLMSGEELASPLTGF